MKTLSQKKSELVLKLLTKERGRLSRAFHGTVGDFNTFVATVDCPQL